MAIRNKPSTNATATHASASAGAYAGAPEFNANVDKKLSDLQQQLKSAQARLATAAARLDEARSVLTEAQQAYDAAEVKHLAGSMDDRAFGRATATRDDAKRTQAQAMLEHEAAERMVRLLPAAFLEAKQAAQARVRDNPRRAAAEKAAKLAALLAEAKAMSDELLALRDAADDQFPVEALLQLGCGGLMAAHDLGEQGGFVTRAAGIPPLHCPWLTNDRAYNGLSMFDLWLREVEAYLALTPEQRAAQDVRYRANAIANAERARKDDVVKQALYERWSKQQPFPQDIREVQPLVRPCESAS